MMKGSRYARAGAALAVLTTLCLLPTAASADTAPSCSPPVTPVSVRSATPTGVTIGCDSGASVVVTTGPSHGTLTQLSAASFIYKSAAAYSGSDSVTFHATAGHASSDSYTVTFAASPSTNNPPYCVPEQIYGYARIGLTRTFRFRCDDPDGDSLDPGSLSATLGQNSDRYGDQLTYGLSGSEVTLDFTPGAGAPVGVSGYLHFAVSDAPPPAVQAKASPSYDVQFGYRAATSNLAPACAPSPEVRVASGRPTTIETYCEDPEGDPFGLTSQPSTPSLGTVDDDPAHAGDLRFTPAAGVAGRSFALGYTMTDAPPGGIPAAESSPQAMTVDIDNPPSCKSAAASSAAGAAAVIELTCSDPDAQDAGALTLTVGRAAHGTVTVTGARAGAETVRYQPQPGFVGTDGFTYAASDGLDRSASAAVHVTVAGKAAPARAGTTPGVTLDGALARLAAGVGPRLRAAGRHVRVPVPAALLTSPGTLDARLLAKLGRHTVVIAAGRADAAAPRPKALELRLSHAAARRLARSHRLVATLWLRLHDRTTGISRSRSVRVVITTRR